MQLRHFLQSVPAHAAPDKISFFDYAQACQFIDYNDDIQYRNLQYRIQFPICNVVLFDQQIKNNFQRITRYNFHVKIIP